MACVAGKHAKNHGRSQLCVYSDWTPIPHPNLFLQTDSDPDSVSRSSGPLWTIATACESVRYAMGARPQ
jgi:hypothetical protein